MKNSKIIFFFVLLFSTSISVKARWCKYEDADFKFNSYNETITVKKDGTSESIYDLKAIILKENGRSIFSKFRLNYNDDCSQIYIIEAKTIYQGKEYIVDKDMIEDKPLASFGEGFDQRKQLTISFPKVEIGAEIHIKYKEIQTKTIIDNFYGYYSYYLGFGYIEENNIKIASELPLNIKINDPRDSLKLQQETKNNIHYINISLKKPIYEELTNEPHNSFLNDKNITWVSLSSVKKWEEIAKKLAPDYYNVINQPLPAMFMEIANVASNKKDDEEKIDYVTSSLNDRIQYMGDWRSIKGRYCPRNLEKIADSQIGDCKDFTAATAAILQKIGYKVQPVLVMRGIKLFDNYESLPNIYGNHVMLKVTCEKQKKEYWIDPTNYVSMAKGIFPDIANKYGLLLDPTKGRFVKIPTIDPRYSKVIHNKELTLCNKIINQKGQISVQGQKALELTGLGMYYSNEQLQEMFSASISGKNLDEEEKKSFSVALPDLTSRIVKDLNTTYTFNKKNSLFNTNKGKALQLNSSEAIENITNVKPDQVSDIFIGLPYTSEEYIKIKKAKIKECDKLNFKINSPWLSIARSCNYTKDNETEFVSKMVIKESFVTNEQLKTSEYKNLKEQLEYNFNKVMVVIEE